MTKKLPGGKSSLPKTISPADLKVGTSQQTETTPQDRPDQGGEGGKSAPFTPSNRVFLDTIFSELPEGARVAVTAKSGDPSAGGWTAHDAADVETLCTANKNTYFNCASLFPDGDALLARKEHAVAYHALVLDDVGTKVDRAALGDVQPTWELETSQGNFQVGFKLSPPLTDPAEVERFQQAIAAAGLTDKGAQGMVRWVRLPVGSNGKPANVDAVGQPFSCRLHQWNPDTAYSAAALEQLLVPKVAASPQTTMPKPQAVRSTPDGVFHDRLAENPVVTAFKQRGLYKRQLAQGKHDVTCPWLDEHTDAIDHGTAFYEPSHDFPNGGFVCQHSHRDKYKLAQVLEQFGLELVDARNRPVIRVTEGEMPAILAAAEEQLSKLGKYYHAGNVIVTVRQDPATGEARIEPLGEPALTLALSEAADWEKFDGRSKTWRRSDPPGRHVTLLYKAERYRYLPELRGFARQPYYDDKGTLIAQSGYHPETCRLAIFDGDRFSSIGCTREAAEAALDEIMSLLAEFHFASTTDRSAALSAILTAVVRPSLAVAPAYHVSAPSSGTGKSYQCEVIALFAGPGGAARISYPRTSEEATKTLLSVLMPNPAVVEFDDMDIEWIPHGAINRMLTSPTITDRVLGVSKVATVSTRTLVLGSGNNVGPIRDTLRRVITIKLNARSEAPGTITYKGNPVAKLRAERERFVSAALTIIEAWKAAGCQRTNVSSIASYGGAWADYCRHPLIWLGQPDPATSLLEQMRTDPDADYLLRLLELWHAEHGDRPITLRRLLKSYDNELEEALSDLPVMERGQVNRSRLGHLLKRNQDRIIGGYILQKAPNTERNAWRVIRAETGPGKEVEGEPSLPPSSGSAR